MSRKKKAAESNNPSTLRVAELVALVTDETSVLGPLDREDLHEALCELVLLRSEHITISGAAPRVDAAATTVEA